MKRILDFKYSCSEEHLPILGQTSVCMQSTKSLMIYMQVLRNTLEDNFHIPKKMGHKSVRTDARVYNSAPISSKLTRVAAGLMPGSKVDGARNRRSVGRIMVDCAKGHSFSFLFSHVQSFPLRKKKQDTSKKIHFFIRLTSNPT